MSAKSVDARRPGSCLVGSGRYDIKIEKVFIEERVVNAVDTAPERRQGGRLQGIPGSVRRPSVFLGTYVFVLDAQVPHAGRPRLSDAPGRDLSGFKDAVGFPVIAELIKQAPNGRRRLGPVPVAEARRALPRGSSSMPAKCEIGGETLIVGSDYLPRDADLDAGLTAV